MEKRIFLVLDELQELKIRKYCVLRLVSCIS